MNTSIDRFRISAVAIALLATVIVALAGTAPGAEAHTTVTSTSASSKVLRITFSGPIRKGTVRATNSRGKVISRGRGSRDPRNASRLKVSLKNAKRGPYTAAWTIVAADGHSQSGTVSFRVR